MESRAYDWLAQGENDLLAARSTIAEGFYAQACFLAQQGAEKALKGLAFRRGFTQVCTHSIRQLAMDLKINGEVQEAGRVLDLYYISARYPDALPEGAPFQAFSEQQARLAVAQAERILKHVNEGW